MFFQFTVRLFTIPIKQAEYFGVLKEWLFHKVTFVSFCMLALLHSKLI